MRSFTTIGVTCRELWVMPMPSGEYWACRTSPERCSQATSRCETFSGVIWLAREKCVPPGVAPKAGQSLTIPAGISPSGAFPQPPIAIKINKLPIRARRVIKYRYKVIPGPTPVLVRIWGRYQLYRDCQS